MELLDTIKEHGPWITLNQLRKLTGRTPESLRKEIKLLLAQDRLTKIGKLKGTKYGLAGTEVPEPKDPRAEIVRILTERKSEVSRTDIAKIADINTGLLKEPLEALVKEGLIRSNGKTKGQKYWLSSYEDQGLFSPKIEEEKPKNTKVVELPDEKPSNEEVFDKRELILRGVRNLPRNVKYNIGDISRAIFNCAKHSFSYNDVTDDFISMVRAGKISGLKYEQTMDNGWHIDYWME